MRNNEKENKFFLENKMTKKSQLDMKKDECSENKTIKGHSKRIKRL